MFPFCWGGAKAGCLIQPDATVQIVGPIEAAALHPQLTYDSFMGVNCDGREANWCAMMSSPNAAAESSAPPSNSHKMWLNGQIGNSAYIPFILKTNDNKTWGVPGAAGSNAGNGFPGYSAPGGRGQLFPYHVTLTPNDKYLNLKWGQYTTSFAPSLYYTFDLNVSSADLCNPATRPSSAQFFQGNPYQLIANAVSSCNSRLDGDSNIIFPKDISLDKMPVMSANIEVSCAEGVKYDIGWSQGNSPTNGRRGMKCSTADKCNNAVVQYDVFKDAAGKSLVWGNTWSDKNSIYSGEGNKTYPVYVAVYKDQPYPPAGTYKDTVVATIMVTYSPEGGVQPPMPWQ